RNRPPVLGSPRLQSGEAMLQHRGGSGFSPPLSWFCVGLRPAQNQEFLLTRPTADSRRPIADCRKPPLISLRSFAAPWLRSFTSAEAAVAAPAALSGECARSTPGSWCRTCFSDHRR